MTHKILIYFSLSIVFYASYGILNKIIYSADLIRELLLIAIFGIVLKFLFNFLFVAKLKQDGLALGTSITYLFFFISSLFVVKKKILFTDKSIYFTELMFHTLNGLISITITKQIILIFLPGT